MTTTQAFTRHARERITERLTDAGMTQDQIDQTFDLAQLRLEEAQGEDTAIRLMVLERQINQAMGDRSNGNTVWGIYRGGRLITVMLRREDQPSTPEALRVTRIVL